MKCKLPLFRALVIALFLIIQIVLPLTIWAQQNFTYVKGIVHDAHNLPLVGASVVIRNNQTNFTSGTKTNSDGVFAASVPSGGPYRFTFSTVGYEPQTLSGYNLKECTA